MRPLLTAAGSLLVCAVAVGPGPRAAEPDVAESGCLACHQGIEPIREQGSEMLEEILALGEAKGDPAGCVVCHGGSPDAEDKDPAHQGKAFYPDPGSPWVNQKTCGLCHPDHVRVQWHSLMMTEAGKIQGTAWAFGSLTGYEHKWGNYDVENPKDQARRLGTDAYRAYMQRLKLLEPQVFVDRHERLPDAPTDPGQLVEHPELAAFTYLRNQCLRCHHAVKGRQVRGDYRGMGCSSCHIPYGNEGHYEGDDPSIPRDETGHSLVHSIQATRQAKVIVHGHQYSGIPVETCTTCHDRGKRIGVSFQGLMETSYASPYTQSGEGQPALHTKHYLAMHQDVHYQKGMTCQDCHTSIDVHGDGFLAAANLGAVQIECSDCHGTPEAYPWELPLGFMDEYDELDDDRPPRGTAKELTSHVRQGTIYPPRDGYLLTARGNPYSNVVRDGETVIVHSAAGNDVELAPLKRIEMEKTLSLEGLIAMKTVRGHVAKMECYTCHASWAPQCYGCHVRIDYSGGKTSFDWLGAGHRHMRPECRADRGETGYDTTIPGQIEEARSFLRWEDPALGVNGEQRITPVAPGCQVSATIIGGDGEPLVLNRIFRTLPGSEGSGPEGQLSIDMSPTQPHTMTAEARQCESCHVSQKALGHGIGGGHTTRPPDRRVFVDLETVDGHVLPQGARTQMAPIEGLTADWTRFVTEEGEQLQTVGHHFKGSRPLNQRERAQVSREGVCLACHQEIPDRSLAVSLLHHVAEYADQVPKTPQEHNALVHKILLLVGWGQVAAMVAM
ncbi:MAG: cytochrome C, partial [Planctomycetes bacterium]|nr:cytochrome C [Planctomycetota bacterium]